MVGRMPVPVVGVVAALVGAVLATATAEALSCDELSRRFQTASPGELRGLSRQLGVSSRLFADAPGPLRVALDARSPFLVASLTSAAESDWQYLVFAGDRGGCQLVGAVDAPGQVVERPSHHLVRLPGGRTALALRAQARSGTGLALVRETWYLLEKRRLAVVLDYPVRGHMIGWPSTFDRSFVTTAVPREDGDGVGEVQLEFRASYTSGSYIYWMPVESLFVSTRRAYYTWKSTPPRFVLDPVRSDVFDDEIEGLFHDAEEQFLRHNVQELARLAGRASEGQRAWLSHFLDAVPDGPEKRAVMENLR
jgi:hypothetical protein